MDIATIIGYTGAFATGFVLGFLGGGGALFSIPVLVYAFHIEAATATGYSLFLVGIAASTGAVRNIRRKLVDYDSLFYYGLPSLITVYGVRRFVIPNIPDTWFTINQYAFGKNDFILLLLSAVMLTMAYRMITSKPAVDTEQNTNGQIQYIKLSLFAMLVGAFVGIVGAGGGFLMAPVLMRFARLDIKRAISTSLVLVAVNSFIGFLGDIHGSADFDWPFLIVFSGFSIAGVVLGTYLHENTDNTLMRKIFGWFMLVVGIAIVVREVFIK